MGKSTSGNGGRRNVKLYQEKEYGFLNRAKSSEALMEF